MAETFYGMDVHKHFTQVSVLNEEGAELWNGRIDNTLENFRKLFSEREGSHRAVLEATFNWYYFIDMLEGEVDELTLAHPLKVRAIAEAKVKTDKVDARTLAQLLRADLIPKSYIPPQNIRDTQERLRYRFSLVRIRSSIKMKVHSILDKNGIRLPHKDIFGVEGKQTLYTLALRSPYREHLYGYLKYIEQLDSEVVRLDRGFRILAKGNPDVRLLKSIPGVGDIIALLLSYEIGDIGRFHSAKKLCAYAGLVPSIHQSGSTLRMGHITKQGNQWIRWAMTEAAHACVAREGLRLRRFYNHIAKKRGKKVAIIAMGKKLLSIAYHVLKEKTVFHKYELVKTQGGYPVEISGALM